MRYIKANNQTQVNSDKIGVQVHPGVATVTANEVVSDVYEYSSKTTIDNVEYSVVRASDTNIYYCTGETALIDEATYLQFKLYIEVVETDYAELWVAKADFASVAHNDVFYTLDYDETEQAYSNPTSTTIKVDIKFSGDGVGQKCGTVVLPDGEEHTKISPSTSGFIFNLKDTEDNDVIMDGYINRQGKTLLTAIITSVSEDEVFGPMTFTVRTDLDPEEQAGVPEGYFLSDVVTESISGSTFKWVAFIPEDAAEGSTLYIDRSGFGVWDDETAGVVEYNPTVVDSLTENEIGCKFSYSVNGLSFTEYEDTITDENNVIVNIPKYMYLKFSQDVEITEE